ncbi:MAG: decaprenyl-phosphate phosphoribosyltransferase [Myxococcota bacterium]|jgi:decaprenyl-phosphate phosphoribosyltransferase
MDVRTAGATGLFSVLKHFVRALRPVQWVKNVFVLAPLVFGLRLLDTHSLGVAWITFGLFSLVSGAVYLLNDISDRERDRLHPTKRFRPIASGELPVEVAVVGLFVVLGAGLGGAALINTDVALTMAAYFALNVAYTTQLKTVPFLDVGCIALGFLLRVLAGGLAIDVPVSAWLLACTFLLATLLALGKRKHELMAVVRHGAGPGTRRVLERYRSSHIDLAMRVLALVTVGSYAAYTLSPSTVAHFGTQWLAATIPFVLFGLWRFHSLVQRHGDAQSPTDTMVRDAPFLVNIGAWTVLVCVLIYLQW